MEVHVLRRDDGEMGRNFDEDTQAKVMYHHQAMNKFCYLDTSEQVNSEIMILYAQGLYLHHYKFILDKRIVVFSSRREGAIIQPDSMALNYGYIVNGFAYAFKKKCILCSTPTNNLCSRCKVTFYCGRACQRGDHACHKTMCKKVEQDRVENRRTFEENLN